MPEEQPPKAGAAAAVQQQPQQQKPQFAGFLAEIVEVNRTQKTGISGEVYLVACKILEGKDQNRIIKRNVLGPIKVGDVIRLPDTSREARSIKVK
jgi:small subunit ribosomal protein S28e